ncbi:hypothetical protein RND81_12G064200 [Saponaria officinalis]|uniref:Bifunctional inhibitor/plant lipid transfer protein/seed storage helical domain-containing protein n=1 Tax=Saponaria officinalis TaxID=3572 RepID=A0AAW1H6T5_SAPOF
MASKICITLVSLLLVSILLATVDAQSNCPMALTSLSPCLTFSTSNSSTPSASCCSELANLVQTAPSCLCQALNIGGAQAVGFVLGRVLPSSLPGACNLHIPPMNECEGLGSDPNNTQGTQGSDDGSSEGAYSNATVSKMSSLVVILMILSASFGVVFM